MEFTKEMKKECDEHVEFKLRDILSHITQSINRNETLSFHLAFSGNIQGSKKATHIKEAYEEFLQIFEKEINMPVPNYEMSDNRKRKRKYKAIDEIMKIIHPSERRLVNSFVRIIEEAME